MRRTLLKGAVAWTVARALPGHAQSATAQPFPTGPVKIIIPFTAGGPTDTVARLIAQKLQDIWGQPVLIDYKPGAGTVIGADFVAKAAPTGHTIGMVNSAFTVNPTLRKSLPYDSVKDIRGITQLADMQLALVARSDAPFDTVGELIAYARKNPGKLTYGNAGAGGTTHLAMELMKRNEKIDIVFSPFKGSAPAHTEVMAGRIDLMTDPLLSVLPYVKANRMKLIATFGDQRVQGLDKPVPTVGETLKGFVATSLLGFIAPGGTPPAVIQKISTDTATVLATPEIRQRMQEMAISPVGSTPQQFDAFLQDEMKKWGKVVIDANIQVD